MFNLSKTRESTSGLDSEVLNCVINLLPDMSYNLIRTNRFITSHIHLYIDVLFRVINKWILIHVVVVNNIKAYIID